MVKNDLFAREKMSTSPLIIAHRGASAYAPENTLAAIKMALDAGADGVEFDVQLASDGVPVVIHDPTLDRTTSSRGKISDFTSEELGKIDVGSWFNTKYSKRSNSDFAKETIPTLAQVLALLISFRGLIYIELKPNSTNLRDLAKAVCDAVRDSPLLPQTILKSFKLAAIPEIRCLLPEVQTAALFGLTAFDLLRRRENMIAIARELGTSQISVHHSLITRKMTALAADSRMPITVWTTDNPKWLQKCRKLGIGSLITNDPIKLLECREKIVV